MLIKGIAPSLFIAFIRVRAHCSDGKHIVSGRYEKHIPAVVNFSKRLARALDILEEKSFRILDYYNINGVQHYKKARMDNLDLLGRSQSKLIVAHRHNLKNINRNKLSWI